MKLLIKALQMLEETVRIVEWAFCKRCETEFSVFFFFLSVLVVVLHGNILFQATSDMFYLSD